jgi:hypothetical protein
MQSVNGTTVNKQSAHRIVGTNNTIIQVSTLITTDQHIVSSVLLMSAWHISADLQTLGNPSSHGPFSPRHLTASGNIELCGSVHVRPGKEMAYLSSPPHHSDCCRALYMLSVDTIRSILFLLPAKLSVNYMNILPF